MPLKNERISHEESKLLSRWLENTYRIFVPRNVFWRMTPMGAANELRRSGLPEDIATEEKVAEVLGR